MAPVEPNSDLDKATANVINPQAPVATASPDSDLDKEAANVINPQAPLAPVALENDGGFWQGFQNNWTDPGKGILSKILTTATEGEQAVARGTVNFLSSVGAMDPQQSNQLLHKNEVHEHDIFNYFWKAGGGDSDDPSQLSAGILKFGMGLGMDILMDPLSWIGVGVASEAAKSISIAGQTFKNIDKLSQAERAALQGASAIQKVITSEGAVVDTDKLSQADAASQNLKLLANFANKEVGSDQLFNGLTNLSEGVQGEARAAYQQAATKAGAGYFDKWATGEKGLTLGVHVPFTDYAFSYDVPAASMITKPTGAFMSGILKAVGSSALIDNGPVRALTNGINSVWTKTGYPLWDAMKNRWFGLKNNSEDLANEFASEWYPKLQGQNLEQLSFLTEYYVADPEAKAAFWSEKTAQEFHDSELTKLANKNSMSFQEAKNYTDHGDDEVFLGKTPADASGFQESYGQILDKMPGVQESENARLLKKFTFDPAVVKKRFPDFTGINDTEKEFLQAYHAQMDARVSEMSLRPGLHFQQLDPREEGSANEYLTHKISNDWWEDKQDTAQAVEYMWDQMESRGLLVDRNNLGRKYRGYVADANAKNIEKTMVPELGSAEGESGVKKFMDDPVYLATQRMKGMDGDIRNYDLMQTAGDHALILNKGEQVPKGYILSQKSHFGGVDEAKIGEFSRRPEDELKRSPDGYIWRRFVPPSWTQNEGRFAVPEKIYNSLLDTVNPKQYSNFTQGLMDLNDKFMRLFRNSALFGPGYLGMKMSSDLFNFLTAGHFSNPAMTLVDAVRSLHPMDDGALFHFMDNNGVRYELNQKDLYSLMLEQNVVRSNIMQSHDLVDVAENIATTEEARRTMGQKIYNVMDMANLWYLNRKVTSFAENIPKAALFIDRLRGGFSPEAAAEVAERAFGNFNNQNLGARALGQIFPFTSVSIKTLEGTAARVAMGEFAHLAIPGKVQAALQGAFVPDPDTRQMLSQSLPAYMREATDRIHGPLLPGQKEVLIEFPWVLNTLHFFMDPKENIHPIAKLLMAWGTSSDEQQWDNVTPYENMAHSVGVSLGKVVPSYLKNALALAELNGVFNFGGSMKEGLLGEVGTSALGLDKLGVSVPRDDKNKSLESKFNDAVEFGQFLEKHRGESWLYDTIFPEVDADSPIGPDAYKLAQRGQFIAQHFRDLSLGYATITDMDKNVAMNMGAMKRQSQKLMQNYQESIAQQGFLPNVTMTAEQAQEAARTDPNLNKALEIRDKMDALHDYYDWYVGVEKKYSGINPWKLLFGEYKMDLSDKPIPLKQMESSSEGADQ